jgi:hypothetical protein
VELSPFIPAIASPGIKQTTLQPVVLVIDPLELLQARRLMPKKEADRAGFADASRLRRGDSAAVKRDQGRPLVDARSLVRDLLHLQLSHALRPGEEVVSNLVDAIHGLLQITAADDEVRDHL